MIHNNDKFEIQIETEPSSSKGHVIKKNLESVPIIPIMNSPIFPGMIAPVVLTEEKFIRELDRFLQKSEYVALNLVKVVDKKRKEVKSKMSKVNKAKAKGKNSESSKELSKKAKLKGKNKERAIKESKISEIREVGTKDIYQVGVICKVIKKLKLPDGSVNILVHGLKRYRATEFLDFAPLLIARPKIFEDILETDQELDAYTRSVINQVKKLSEINPYFNEEMKLAMLNSPSPGALADLVAFSLSLDTPEAQDFLETLVVKKRFAKLLVYLEREKNVADIQKKITDEVNDKVTKYQKEYFLREQLKVIRNELGLDEDDKTRDMKKIREGIVQSGMPEHVAQSVLEELDKLETTPDTSPEYSVTRNYLNWMVHLPWNKSTKDAIDIVKARKILEHDHYGLEKAKERILEFLAVRKLRPQYDGTILCFSGPPGVGKTSLGKSIAKALGRKFFRFSLGGMRDEAEIKGHRRTYVGAMPGKIIQALKRVEVNNPVIMLDEVDKMSHSFQGDPASALLEVLDPEQNSTFIDNYLDVPFDLSKVLFIATANYLGEIPEPLLDRMEVIELSGYTLEEKVTIASRWVLPKQLKKHGLTSRDLILSKKVMKKIISDYAREPGVRVMEQYIAKLCRKAALAKVGSKKAEKFAPNEVDLEKHLGSVRFQTELAETKLDPGIVIGLAWTAYGGDILFIESIPLEGKGFKLTGQLGDVMNESANLAYSYVRKLLQKEMVQSSEKITRKALGTKVKPVDKNKEIKEFPATPKNVGSVGNSGQGGESGEEITPLDYLANHEIHLHLPAGATPKDGPSAGISMALALYSLAHNKKVKAGVAMTGELSLTGKVLPIGGLKEKILAAKRAGLKTIIFPKQNEKDLKEVPERHRKGLKLVPVTHFDDVLKVALSK